MEGDIGIMKLKMAVLFLMLNCFLFSCKYPVENEASFSEILSSSKLNKEAAELNEYKNDLLKELYTIYDEKYIDKDGKDIEIVYPQIKGNLDGRLLENINHTLKNHALDCLNNFVPLDELKIKIHYEVYLSNQYYLSIGFLRSMWTTRNPVDVNDAITLDMSNGTRLILKDIVDISDEFAKTYFNRNAFHRGGEELTGEEGKIVKETLQIYLERNALYLCDANFGDDMHSYLTEDSLYIMLPASTAMGDYVIFQTKYSEIKEFMRIDVNAPRFG